jgi:hypothetical protein
MVLRLRASMLALAALGCGLLALAVATSALEDGPTSALNNGVQLLVPAVVAVPCCIGAARHCGRGATGRSWLLLAGGCGSWAAGQALYTWYELVLEQEPFPSAADGFFLLAVPLLVAGVAGQSSGLLTMGRVRVVLDGAVVVTALLSPPPARSSPRSGRPGWAAPSSGGCSSPTRRRTCWWWPWPSPWPPVDRPGCAAPWVW